MIRIKSYLLCLSLYVLTNDLFGQNGSSHGKYGQNDESTSNERFVYHDPSLTAPLKIGDKVPDIVLSEVLNLKGREIAKISDFKGKLLILDFWSIWCTSCIKEFPRLADLQDKYKTTVVILPVGFDGHKEGSIKKYVLDRIGTKQEMPLPTVIQKPTDKILENLFPFESLPHEIWIDSQGTLIGITNSKSVTSTNISAALHGQWPGILSDRKVHNLTKMDPFLIPSQNNEFKFHGSVFTGYIDTLKNMWPFGLQYDDGFFRFYDINRSILDYFINAYAHKLPSLKKEQLKLIQFESDSNSIIRDIRQLDPKTLDNLDDSTLQDYYKKTLFCYEMVLPNTYSLQNVREFVISDLERFFKVTSRIVKRKIPCLALIRTSNKDRIKSRSIPESSTVDYSDPAKPIYQIRGEKIDFLIKTCKANIRTNYLILDETGYDERIDISIPVEEKDLTIYKSVLNKYHLDLIEVEREIDLLVLSSR